MMINLNHEFTIITRYPSLRQYIIGSLTSDQIYCAYYTNNCNYLVSHPVALALYDRYYNEINSIQNGINIKTIQATETIRREAICTKVNVYINSIIRRIFVRHKRIITATSFYISDLYPENLEDFPRAA